MKVLAVTNNKGGVGKTTSTANIGVCLANLGRKVLLIDTDPQSNLSLLFQGEEEFPKTLEHFFSDDTPFEDIITKTRLENLDIAPTSFDLSIHAHQRKDLLKMGIDAIIDDYDHILIDTPPSLTELTPQALNAATGIIIPVLPSLFSLKGVESMHKNRQVFGEIEILGVFICQADKRRVVTQEMIEGYQQFYKMFNTLVPVSEEVKQAEVMQATICELNPRNAVAKAYQELTEEIYGSKQITKTSRRPRPARV